MRLRDAFRLTWHFPQVDPQTLGHPLCYRGCLYAALIWLFDHHTRRNDRLGFNGWCNFR